MPVRFLIEDTNDVLYALHINDDGESSIWTPEGEEPDAEEIEALAALGLEPEVTKNLEHTWEIIQTALMKEREWHELLVSIRAHGLKQTDRRRSYPYEIYSYTYEFTAPEFAAFLGTAIKNQLENYNSYAEDIAQLVLALRNNDESELEFDIEDGKWHEETKPESGSMTSCVDRSITADGEELFEYCVDFERRIHDPITFENYTFQDQEHAMIIAGSPELQEIIKMFGLEKKEEKLNETAVEEAPEPHHPERDDDGEWGVYYQYLEYEIDPKTGDPKVLSRETIVPYWSKSDAEEAIDIMDNYIQHMHAEEYYEEYYIVKRIGKYDWEKSED
jgi:hypothetical protein